MSPNMYPSVFPKDFRLEPNISPTTQAMFEDDDFPGFPFGGICDRSLEGI